MSRNIYEMSLWTESAGILAKLIKDKPKGEFTKLPIFFPLSEIFKPKEGDPDKTIIDVTNISKALTNIDDEENWPEQFKQDNSRASWLANIATYLVKIATSDEIVGKDLSKVFFYMDSPDQSELIKTVAAHHKEHNMSAVFWCVLSPTQEEKPPKVEEVEEELTIESLTVIEEGTSDDVLAQRIIPAKATEASATPTSEEPVDESQDVIEQPQKDA